MIIAAHIKCLIIEQYTFFIYSEVFSNNNQTQNYFITTFLADYNQFLKYLYNRQIFTEIFFVRATENNLISISFTDHHQSLVIRVHPTD